MDRFARASGLAALLAALDFGCNFPPEPELPRPLPAVRVSVGLGGEQADRGSANPSMSQDGRYVAFQSGATNLVAGDTNGVTDIFVRDTVADTTLRVSVDSAGNQADEFSTNPRISPDGRYVAFESAATDLVAGDTNGVTDVFLHDLQTGATVRVSVSSTGGQGNDDSSEASLSADGRYVAFSSQATNLVPGDANAKTDIFVRDLVVGTTILASVTSTGAQAGQPCYNPSISGDGRFVVFETYNGLVPEDVDGLPNAYLRNLVAGTTSVLSTDLPGAAITQSFLPAISSDGSTVAIQSYTDVPPDDTDDLADIFLLGTAGGPPQWVSKEPSMGLVRYNVCTNPSISSDGRVVAFEIKDQGPHSAEWRIYSSNRVTGKRWWVAPDRCFNPAVSGDGRWVAFQSTSPNLVPDDSNGVQDIFVAGPLR